MQYSGQERREFRRTDKKVAASVQVPSHSALHSWQSMYVRNVSAGGLYFEHYEPFATGSFLNFKLKLTPTTHPIRCAGKVLRADKIQGTPLYGIAVQFMDIEPEDFHTLAIFST